MPDPSPLTPLLEQYEGVKARYPGHLVLFRVGDFYETFGDDARLLSRELDVVLTARSADAVGVRTPMAGVPHHSVETYLGRLVRKGYKVAICDQVEEARFAKGLVRREVTRVVTPGTVVEDRILGGPDHNFLVSVVTRPANVGAYSAVDITTGEWYHGPADGPGPEGLVSTLAAFHPREILWSSTEESTGPLLLSALRREFPWARLEPSPAPLAEGELPKPLRIESAASEEVREADRRLAAYLKVTQPRLLPYLALVDRGAAGRRLVLDAKTLRHLEINRPMNPDDAKGVTLLGTWDETVTAPGRRTLSFWLTNPLADVSSITLRQDAVQSLVDRGATLEGWRNRLRSIPDLSRIASRVAGRRVRPNELVAMRAGLETADSLGRSLGESESSSRLAALARELDAPPGLVELLRGALPETLSITDDSDELFRPGHAPEVDRWREAERSALAEMTQLESTEQEATGIRTLKVGYNQVFGYYLEVTKPHLARVPPHFRRRQTVAQAERFTSDRLEEIERRILEAREGIRTAEATRWEELLDSVERDVPAVHRVGRALGELDALVTFAHLAQSRGYVRPTVDESSVLVVRDGRHPVLDRLLGEAFVPNDTDLEPDARRLLVLTGPNMSGKSTYMRQVGLLVVLAQSGSFVPAKFARIGLVTQLFTRMGFTDEIGRGKSSFMVEMSEVAEILRAADDRSLILLDEVGRGTSTFDGLAIAWATLRHIHDATRARSLLATHYHQLTDLVRGLSAAQNAHFAVREGPEGIVFLHRLVPGATDRSYGVHVARLAGVPEGVLEEAERLLRRLESESVLPVAEKGARRRGPRYTQAVLLSNGTAEHPVIGELRRLDADTLDPDQAVRTLRELKRRASSDGEPGSGAP
jgi:DNA mismatch repair protein MutS